MHLPIPRPVDGERVGEVTCGTCGAHLTFRVRSIAATRRLRLLWLALALVSLAVAVVLAVTVYRTDPSGPGGRLIALLLLPALVGFALGIRTLPSAWSEDGVRGPDRQVDTHTHALKPPPRARARLG